MSSPIEAAIFELLEGLGPGKSICPTDVAKRVDPENWRHRLGQVRAEAVFLARVERLVITRHNKPVDPNQFKGVYRLRLPSPGAAEPT